MIALNIAEVESESDIPELDGLYYIESDDRLVYKNDGDISTIAQASEIISKAGDTIHGDLDMDGNSIVNARFETREDPPEDPEIGQFWIYKA